MIQSLLLPTAKLGPVCEILGVVGSYLLFSPRRHGARRFYQPIDFCVGPDRCLHPRLGRVSRAWCFTIAVVMCLDAGLQDSADRIAELEAYVAELQGVVSVNGDGDLLITGANLRIENGLGDTDTVDGKVTP